MNKNFAVNCLNFFLPVPAFSLLLLAILKNQTAAAKSGGKKWWWHLSSGNRHQFGCAVFSQRTAKPTRQWQFFPFLPFFFSVFRVKAPLERENERESEKQSQIKIQKRREEVLKTAAAVMAAMTVQSAKGPAPQSRNGLGTTTREASEWKISIISRQRINIL